MDVADVLLIARDSETIDHVAALASASEVTVETAADVRSASLVWSRAPLIVVGAPELALVCAADLPRRAGIVVFGHLTTDDWRWAFELGAEDVIEPPGPTGWLADRVVRVGEHDESSVVVGVTGCRGGAGGSVFAAALALAATRVRITPYLLDLDPLGCGQAVVLGADGATGLTWDQVSAGAGRIPARSLRSSLGVVEGVALLGWSGEVCAPPPPGVAAAVVDTARRCTPVTIVDLGRASAPYQHEVMARCDRVLMIVPADVRSVQAARRMAYRLRDAACEVVVRGPNPGGLTAADVAEALKLPVLAAVSAERGLDQRLERGEPPGQRRRSPLGRAGDGILADILGRP